MKHLPTIFPEEQSLSCKRLRLPRPTFLTRYHHTTHHEGNWPYLRMRKENWLMLNSNSTWLNVNWNFVQKRPPLLFYLFCVLSLYDVLCGFTMCVCLCVLCGFIMCVCLCVLYGLIHMVLTCVFVCFLWFYHVCVCFIWFYHVRVCVLCGFIMCVCVCVFYVV